MMLLANYYKTKIRLKICIFRIKNDLNLFDLWSIQKSSGLRQQHHEFMH